jgi:hypothetical protein
MPCLGNCILRWFPNWSLCHLQYHRRRADRNASSEKAEEPVGLFANSELIGGAACVGANWELAGAWMGQDENDNASGFQLMAPSLENLEMQGTVRQCIGGWLVDRNWVFTKFCIELSDI